ncbi:MAG: FemAB family XrtA/PEP-CTERM system-associated protein [Phycisphaerae bacterium]
MNATTVTTTATTDPCRREAPASALTIQPLHEGPTRQAWAGYVANAAAGSLFHHPDWCETVESVFDHHALHRIALRDDRVVGVLPLFEVRNLLAGKLLVSVPYGTYGGMLGDDEQVREALASEAVQLAEERGVRALELRTAKAGVVGLIDDERYAVFVRPLPSCIEELASYLPRKARAAVRQAQQREGLSVQHDTVLLRTVWQLYARSMRRLASINYPYRFFQALVERLGARAWVTMLWKANRPVAGLLSFVFRDTVYPYFVGVDERIRCTGATNLLYFAVMERAVRAGLRRFDFGRSRKDNSGAFNFKRNQGFEPETLGYQRYVPSGRRPPDLTPDNPRFSLARRVWPRLPLAATKTLGAWLAKSIPG